jgi:type VI secretion system secreted protein VgrG
MAGLQDHRLIRFDCGLPPDDLVVSSFEGREALSELFSFRLELLSTRDDIDPKNIVGKPARLEIELAGGGTRQWSGHVAQFAIGTTIEGWVRYEAQLVPWFWFCTLVTDARVFQNLSVPDIVREVLDDLQFKDYRIDVNGTYANLEYCVQYLESTFAFVSRLLEQAGIHYFFEFRDGKHVMVMTDHPDGHDEVPSSPVRFHRTGRTEESDSVSQFSRRMALHSGRTTLRGFDFKRPNAELEVSSDTVARIGDNSALESFGFGIPYAEASLGEAYARVLMEAEESRHEHFEGVGDCREFSAGLKLVLDGHPIGGFDASYLLTEVLHRGTNNFEDGVPTGSTYSNVFHCIPSATPFRAPWSTPKPRIRGLQSAVIVGPRGEEIHTDEHARVRVQFQWDRRGEYNDKSSCWVRVAQTWAGNGWGAQFIPRIGQEVVVAFLEGDPDQPIVVGSVYNGLQKPPFALPANATTSGIKSNSSKGGQGFNELRFEDKKGSERLFLNAEKDMDVRVKNDSKETVGNNQHILIGKDQMEEVKGDRHTAVKGDWLSKVTGNRGESVTGNLLVKSSQNAHLKAGMEIVINAGMQITLKAGAGSIVIGPSGVQIDGPLVQLNCGGSGSSPEEPDGPKPPEQAEKSTSGKVSSAEQRQQASALKRAAKRGAPFVSGV